MSLTFFSNCLILTVLHILESSLLSGAFRAIETLRTASPDFRSYWPWLSGHMVVNCSLFILFYFDSCSRLYPSWGRDHSHSSRDVGSRKGHCLGAKTWHLPVALLFPSYVIWVVFLISLQEGATKLSLSSFPALMPMIFHLKYCNISFINLSCIGFCAPRLLATKHTIISISEYLKILTAV